MRAGSFEADLKERAALGFEEIPVASHEIAADFDEKATADFHQKIAAEEYSAEEIPARVVGDLI